jgi:hypothetical protein
MGNTRPRYRQVDIDRLFAGATPEDGDLVSLLPLVHLLHGVGASMPPDSAAEEFSHRAAVLARSARQTQAVKHSYRTIISGAPRRNYRLAGAFAALVLMLSASIGIAYAANGSAPGDSLYGLDLALENMGIGVGGLDERLAEANHLVQKGQLQQGLTQAGEAIASSRPDDSGAILASEALLEAADAVAAPSATDSATVRRQVARRLSNMADAELAGNEIGLATSSLADGIFSFVASTATPTSQTTSTVAPQSAVDQSNPVDPGTAQDQD